MAVIRSLSLAFILLNSVVVPQSVLLVKHFIYLKKILGIAKKILY